MKEKDEEKCPKTISIIESSFNFFMLTACHKALDNASFNYLSNKLGRVADEIDLK